MSKGEMDLGLGPNLIPAIIQVIMIDHLVFIVMVETEMGIGFTLANSLHIPSNIFSRIYSKGCAWRKYPSK